MDPIRHRVGRPIALHDGTAWCFFRGRFLDEYRPLKP